MDGTAWTLLSKIELYKEFWTLINLIISQFCPKIENWKNNQKEIYKQIWNAWLYNFYNLLKDCLKVWLSINYALNYYTDSYIEVSVKGQTK